MRELEKLEAQLAISFRDKSLLLRALTHRSYLNENPDLALTDNERLEFLGDALLDFVVAEHLYHRFPEMQEGEMTSLRSALVQERTLAELARRLDLGSYLRLGRGENAGGGRHRAPLLCGAYEALVGAVFLDQGLDLTKQWLLAQMSPLLDEILEQRRHKDPKSQLQELSQGLWQITPAYRTVSERGPDHAKEFTVEVVIGGQVFGQGEGRSKRDAEEAAARAALARLEGLEEIRPEAVPRAKDVVTDERHAPEAPGTAGV